MIIQETVAFVQTTLEGAEGGHDWFHIERVWKNARHIAATEGGDLLVVELAALLHDIADSKFHGGDETVGPAKARDWMQSLGLPEETVAHVVAIIENISFKGGNVERRFHSKELDIVQDADRLDALGAVGIARTFNYGGFKNRPLYDPSVPPQLGMSKEEYKSSTSPTLNHFYEKLFLLKDRMNTETGKSLALDRHRYMEEFVARFLDEWAG